MTGPGSPPPPPRGWRRPVFLLLALAALVGLWFQRQSRVPPRSLPASASPGGSTLDSGQTRAFLAIEAGEAEADRTAWVHEVTAQSFASRIDSFWEALNARRGQLDPLLRLPVATLRIPSGTLEDTLPFDIRRRRSVAQGLPVVLDPGDPRLERWRTEGWGLDQSEWRHVRFEPATEGSRPVSTYLVSLHFSRPRPPARAQIEARIRLHWTDTNGPPATLDRPDFGDLEVEEFVLLRRDAPPVFREAELREIAPFPRTHWVDPVILRFPRGEEPAPPEILLAARNLHLRRDPAGQWHDGPLCDRHPGLVFTALLADFTGDGDDDLLFAVRSGLVLVRGRSDGRFPGEPEPAWTAPERLEYAQAFTCGDADGDGDLDVFLGQYRTPYDRGQMPRPYFDALDGPPAYLLLNDGGGRFIDATPGSGLEPKRHRRSYGASFADLDADGDLDLLVTSDFAGTDLYLNDGAGRFVDATATALGSPRAFGMSHTLADFDADGALDLFLVGMPQPTADRLNSLGIERPGFATWAEQRPGMVTGNRLFLRRPPGYRVSPDNDSLARAGWAWSAATLDLDGNRLPDLHVVNGHETRSSVRDYEREFWLHDIYVGTSTPRPAVEAYFASRFAATRARGWSYGGYDKNRFYLNLGSGGFAEVGHLLGLALEADSRNTLAGDFDGDGDEDLLVTTFEVWPVTRQTLRIFENTAPPAGHWIELRLQPGESGLSPIGASVSVRDRLGLRSHAVITGDGYRSQQAPLVRFALGPVDRVDEVEVRWPNRPATRLVDLPTNRRHVVSSPRR